MKALVLMSGVCVLCVRVCVCVCVHCVWYVFFVNMCVECRGLYGV